jgi:integrase/recombinase XerC/integrase/recombinase XerD
MTRERESFRRTTYHAHPELQLAPHSDVGGWDDEEPRTPLEVFLRPLSPLDLPGKEHLERYVYYKYRLNRKPTTLLSTVSTAKLFLVFFKETGKAGLEELGREDLEAFVEHEQDRGMKPMTVHTRWAVLRAFLYHLIREGILDREILSRSIQIKLPDTLPKAIPPGDVKRMLSVLDDVRNRAIILVLLRTGMRIGELLNTRVMDVHLKERKIEIPQGEKNAIGRVVYLSDDARTALAAWLNDREERSRYVFYTLRSKKMHYATARAMFKRNLAKAGLGDKGYTLHRLRHTFASEMLNAGMRLECLQQILGHSRIEVTRRYARLTDKAREREYFRAMEVIERGGIHGHYQFDPELQAFLEETELLEEDRNQLPERPEAVPAVGQCAD